jgi:hypothetical protein
VLAGASTANGEITAGKDGALIVAEDTAQEDIGVVAGKDQAGRGIGKIAGAMRSRSSDRIALEAVCGMNSFPTARD